MELTFGEQIKIILKRKNMTIRQLAELIEVQTGKPMSRQNLTQKLNRDNFQEQDMREVAQALGCLVQISVIDPMEATVASLQAIMPANPVSDETMVLSDETMVLPDETMVLSDETMVLPDETMVLPEKPVGEPGESSERPEEPAAWMEKTAVQGRGRLVRGGRRTMAVLKPAVSPEPEAAKWGVRTAEEKQPEPAESVKTGTEPEPAVEVNGDLLKEIEQALSQSVESELREEGGAGSAEQSGYNSAGAENGRKQQEPQNDPLAWASRRPAVWPTLHIPEEPAQAEEKSAGSAEASEELEFEPIEVESEEASMEPEPYAKAPENAGAPEYADVEPEDAGEPEYADMEPGNAGVPEYADMEPGNAGESEYADMEPGNAGVPEYADMEPENAGVAEYAEADPAGSEYEAGEAVQSGKLQDQQPEEIHPEQLVQLDPVFFELDELDGGDISGVSAPYSIKREESGGEGSESGMESETGDEHTNETGDGGHAPIDYHSMSSIPGGDVSYVSAPYVIEREEEPEEPAYKGFYEIPEDELADIAFDESEDRIPDFGETKEEPDLGKKLAEWDAAVQKTLEKPLFLTPEERRARKEAEEAERAVAEAEAKEEAAGLPTVDPATGREYETNTVMHHPSKPDTLLVYDSDEHRWIEQNERAFNNFQIRKRALLGKDYEPPVYLD